MLEPKDIDISLAGGVDQSVPKELVDGDGLITVRNVRHTKQGTWSKRYGTSEYGKAASSSQTGWNTYNVSKASSVFEMSGVPNIIGDKQLLQWSDEGAGWVRRTSANVPSCEVTQRTLKYSDSSLALEDVRNADVASNGTLTVHVMVKNDDPLGTPYIAALFYEAATGVLIRRIVTQTSTGGQLSYVRVVATASGRFWFVWANGATKHLFASLYDADGTELEAATQITGAGSTTSSSFVSASNYRNWEVALDNYDGESLCVAFEVSRATLTIGAFRITYSGGVFVLGTSATWTDAALGAELRAIAIDTKSSVVAMSYVTYESGTQYRFRFCTLSNGAAYGAAADTEVLAPANFYAAGYGADGAPFSTEDMFRVFVKVTTSTSGAGANLDVITGFSTDGDNTPFDNFTAPYWSTVPYTGVLVVYRSTSTISTSPTTFKRIYRIPRMMVAQQPFEVTAFAENKVLLPVYFVSDTQSTSMLLDCMNDRRTDSLSSATDVYAPLIAAVGAPGLAWVTSSSTGGGIGYGGGWSVVSHPIQVSADVYDVMTVERAEDGRPAFVLRRYDYAQRRLASAVTSVQGTAMIDGGVPCAFDGQAVFEAGPVFYPEVLAVRQTNNGSGLPAGTYYFTFVWKITDKSGNVWRSAPSIPYSVTLAAAQEIEFLMDLPPSLLPNGTWWDREGGTSTSQEWPRLELEMYRTDVNPPVGAPAKYVGVMTSFSQAGDTYGGCTWRRTITTEIDDTVFLYTTGRVLEHVCPGPLVGSGVWQQRVVGIPVDRTRLVHSTPVSIGSPPRFNELYTVSVDPDDSVVGWAGLDEKMVIVGKVRAYIASGEPLDTRGDGAGLRVQQLTAPGGVGWRSVVDTPIGVVYQTADGMCVITPQLEVVETFGEAVRDELIAYPVITAARYFQSASEVRFACRETETSSTGIELVFHTKRKQWSVSEYTAVADDVSGVAIRAYAEGEADDLYFVTDAGRCIVADRATHMDGGTEWVEKQIVTPWVKMTSLASFQRVWRAIVTATKRSRANLILDYGVDYDETWYDAQTLLASDIPDGKSVFQKKFGIRMQKVTAMRFRLRDARPDTGAVGTGEGHDWTAISAKVAVKKGVGKTLRGGAGP